MTHEIQDTATEGRIWDFAETNFKPRFFGDENDRFAFWFGYDSTWPRGQVNAAMMLAESATPGAWWRVFNEPALMLASEPTLRGIDYPSIGIRRAQNDMTQHVLTIETTAATLSRRGDPTCFTIDPLASPAEVSLPTTRWSTTPPPTSGTLRLARD